MINDNVKTLSALTSVLSQSLLIIRKTKQHCKGHQLNPSMVNKPWQFIFIS